MEGRFLQGKVAVITGASRGLGRAMALALGESGAKLALAGRDKSKLAESQNLAKDKGVESEIFIADVRDEAQVGKLGQDVIARFGGAHILINNAGTAVRKHVADFTLDEWKLVLDTNLTGAFLVSRAFIPHMKAASGAVSSTSRRSWPTSAAPAAARIALPRPGCSASPGAWRWNW
jgi:2-deoxy-D-gluconate 3-dehydrogenase